MDAVKILGELLGNRQMSRGRGQNILQSILGGAGGGGAPPQRSAPRAHAQGQPIGNNPLGGLIRAAVEQYGNWQNQQAPDQYGQQHEQHQHGHGQQPRQVAQHPVNAGGCRFPDDRAAANHQAQLLIRAMINAAKSDCNIDQEEQQKIVSKLGRLSQEEIQFLRQEFARPLDTRAFAREVPPGLEDEVYAISLTAIDLDTNQEAKYLHELSHELELSHEQVNHIHHQLGERPLFS